MDFQYSGVIDPAAYDAQGLCNGISLRVHMDQISERAGSMRAQRDWTRLIVPVEHYRGGLGA